jgi:type IV pilus assembly protein PilM
VPRTTGIDISDTSIKWIALSDEARGRRTVEAWSREPLAEGIVESGTVKNEPALIESLRAVKKQLPHRSAIHASLPEEPAFVFNMNVPAGLKRQEILNLVEFEFEARVPIPPSAAVYDFDLIPREEGEPQEIGVAVFPREIAESYARCFSAAGFVLLSLELEPRAIARAVSEAGDNITLLVDFGFKRTGIAVLKRGIPIFTSTVDVGVEGIDRALTQQLHLSPEEIETWKNEQGLVPTQGQQSSGLEVLSGAASALGSEVARHFNYWDTRRNEQGERVTPVSRVLLVGGGSNLKGLADYIAGRVQAPVVRPNVWANVCSFEKYIPPIPRRTSLQYATAVGLSLRA